MEKKLKTVSPTLFHSHAVLKVRYRDLDTFNHVNNAVYPSYMEFGRLDYMHRFLENMINWKEKGFILGTNHIVHLAPLFLFDEVHIYTGVGRIGNRNVTFISLINNSKGEMAAVGYSILVAFNFLKNRSILIPEEWKNIFIKTDEKLMTFFNKE